MSKLPEIKAREVSAAGSTGCVELTAGVAVGEERIEEAVIYRPWNTTRAAAEAELLEKLANKVARANWRRDR